MKINFAPVAFVCFYFTQLSVFINAADREIHHAVLEKNYGIHCLSSCTFWILSSLSGLSMY